MNHQCHDDEIVANEAALNSANNRSPYFGHEMKEAALIDQGEQKIVGSPVTKNWGTNNCKSEKRNE